MAKKEDGPSRDAVAKWVEEQVATLLAAGDPKELREAVLEMGTTFDRFAQDMDHGLATMRTAMIRVRLATRVDDQVDGAGTVIEPLPSSVPADTILSIQVPRTLTNYLERVALPQVLVRPFAAKVPRKQGPGYSDTVTLHGPAEIEAMLTMLHDHKSPSGWFTLATRVIKEIEDGVRRQASLGD